MASLSADQPLQRAPRAAPMTGERYAVPTRPEEKLYGAALRIELAVALRTLYQNKQVP